MLSLKYCTENGYLKDVNAVRLAIENNNLKCLIYCSENGFFKDFEATELAAKLGHFECLKYCTENRFHKSEKAYGAASDENIKNYLKLNGYKCWFNYKCQNFMLNRFFFFD